MARAIKFRAWDEEAHEMLMKSEMEKYWAEKYGLEGLRSE